MHLLKKPNLHKSLIHNVFHLILDVTVFSFLYVVLVEWLGYYDYWLVAGVFIFIKRTVDAITCFLLYELYDKLREKK